MLFDHHYRRADQARDVERRHAGSNRLRNERMPQRVEARSGGQLRRFSRSLDCFVPRARARPRPAVVTHVSSRAFGNFALASRLNSATAAGESGTVRVPVLPVNVIDAVRSSNWRRVAFTSSPARAPVRVAASIRSRIAPVRLGAVTPAAAVGLGTGRAARRRPCRPARHAIPAPCRAIRADGSLPC